MKGLEFFRKNYFYFLGLAVLSGVVLMNLFPEGYIFAGGDTIQLISAGDSFQKLFYAWNGMAAPFYFIFYLLDKTGISDSLQLSFYLGVFIFGAYISFDFFVRMLFPENSGFIRMAGALFYALNLFTLYAFTANWGYSYFLSLYIFIPILAAFYIKFLKTFNWFFGVSFVIILFLASSGFGNPAFAISFSILLALLTFALAIAKEIKLDIGMFRRLAILFLLSFLANAYWILPLIPQVRSGVAGIYSSDVLELNWVLNSTSNPISDTLRLMHYSGDYFPDNFPYKKLLFLKEGVAFLAFLPFFLFVAALFFMKKFSRGNRKYFLVFWMAFLVLIVLVAKVRPPFELINHCFYNIWGMNTMRGYDKMAIYTPFVMAVLLTIVLSEIKNKKAEAVLAILIIIIPLPFYLGKIQQNMSYRFSNASIEKKDFRKASLSFLVKIPDEYYEIRSVVNNDPEKSFIATLPYSSNDGSGISSYPEWKIYGADVTQHLYKKTFIEANGFSFSGWNFAKEFNEGSDSPEWLAKLLGMMNARYIIYHKDAPKDSVRDSQEKINSLEKNNFIKKIEENHYFSLYSISDDLFVPYVTWQKENVEMAGSAQSVGENFDAIKSNLALADFHEINPRKYAINIDENVRGDIIFAESYNPNWKAYVIGQDGKETEIENHFIARGYANGWRIGNSEDINKVVIEYYPTRLMWRGIWISGITILFLAGYLLKCYYVRKNKI